MRWAPTPKCASYAALVAVGLLAGLASGRPEPIVLAAPLAMVLAVGLATFRRPEITVQRTLDPQQATEGDDVDLTIALTATAPVASVEVFVELSDVFEAPSARRRQRFPLRAGATHEMSLPVSYKRWGAHRTAETWIRARSAFGLLEAEGRLPAIAVTVYPNPETLRRLVAPRHTQHAPGNHVARAKGAGLELADVRSFNTGDRVRDVNWRATARHGTLLVNDRHPDRSTDVVLFLDTFDDTTLPDAVRVTNSLATSYLAHRDRVGLVSFGGTLNWLRPGMGSRQQYLVVHALLTTATFANAAWKDIADIPPRVLPPRALVVAVTPMQDDRIRSALLDMRSRGIDLVVIEVSPIPFAAPPPDEDTRLARRLWVMQREALRNRYRSVGVPVVEWTAGRPLAEVVEEIRAWPRIGRHAG